MSTLALEDGENSLFGSSVGGVNDFGLFINGQDDRFSFECSEEDVWIPMDQTIHWGKRPNSTYPAVKLLKDKSEIPKIPRGRHLVARLLAPEWEWDEKVDTQNRQDPNQTSCLEEDKTVVPFEKGVATFRHLRASKSIKLKGTESVLIRTLRVELGHHNAFDTIPFKSLDIFLSKTVKVHLVAHKRSVEIMQRHGLLPTPMEAPKKEKKESAPSTPVQKLTEDHLATLRTFLPQLMNTSNEGRGSVNPIQMSTLQSTIQQQSLSNSLPATLQMALQSTMQYPQTHSNQQQSASMLNHPNANARNLQTALRESLQPLHVALQSSLQPIQNHLQNALQSNIDLQSTIQTHLKQDPQQGSRKRLLENVTMIESETLKKQKETLITDIFDGVNQIQQSIDYLGKRVVDFINLPTTTTIQITCDSDLYPPSVFIFYAFRTRDMDLALTMIEKTKDFSIDMRDEKGYTLLHTAAKSGFFEGVMWCLYHHADPNALSNSECTPLHFAYQRNDKPTKRALKQAGANTEAINAYGMKPRDYKHKRRPLVTHSLCQSGRVEVLLSGLERPFPLSIWYAARIGWLEVVVLYVENLGTDVDTKNSNGQTPLMCAAEYSRTNVVEYLISAGADPNARDIHDKTPLHYAYISGDARMLRVLQNSGSDPNLNNVWRRTPSFYEDKDMFSKTI